MNAKGSLPPKQQAPYAPRGPNQVEADQVVPTSFGLGVPIYPTGFPLLSKRSTAGGKASGEARMEKLTPEQRVAVAKTAAAARWAKPVTQEDLKRQSVLQVAEWTADRVAQMGAEDINRRLAGGVAMKPGKLTFDKKLKMATAKKKKSTVRPPVPVVAAKKSKARPRSRRKPKP